MGLVLLDDEAGRCGRLGLLLQFAVLLAARPAGGAKQVAADPGGRDC